MYKLTQVVEILNILGNEEILGKISRLTADIAECPFSIFCEGLQVQGIENCAKTPVLVFGITFPANLSKVNNRNTRKSEKYIQCNNKNTKRRH